MGSRQMHEQAFTDAQTGAQGNRYGRPTDSEMGVR